MCRRNCRAGSLLPQDIVRGHLQIRRKLTHSRAGGCMGYSLFVLYAILRNAGAAECMRHNLPDNRFLPHPPRIPKKPAAAICRLRFCPTWRFRASCIRNREILPADIARLCIIRSMKFLCIFIFQDMLRNALHRFSKCGVIRKKILG